MNLRQSSFYVSVGALARLSISLLSVPILVRVLGIERYGIWIVLNSVVAIGALSEFGISAALIHRLSSELARRESDSAGNSLFTSLVLVTCFGFIAAVFFWLVSAQISHLLFAGDSNLGEATHSFSLLAWLVPLRLWQNWAMAVEAASLRYDWQSVIETIGGLILQIGLLVLAFLNNRLEALAVWTVVVSGGILLGHWLVLKHILLIQVGQFHYSRHAASVLLHFGFMQWVSNVGSTFFGYVDRIIVNLILGATAAGLYSAATAMTAKINELSAIPLRVIPPAISSAQALSDKPRVQQLFMTATRVNGLGVCIIAVALLFWSYPIAGFLVGTEYVTQVSELLRILSVAYGIYSLNAAGFFTAIGIGYPRVNARWGLLGGVLACILIAFLARQYGLVGAALGNFGYALTIMINLQIVKLVGIKFSAYLKIFLLPVVSLVLWWVASTITPPSFQPFWLHLIGFVLMAILTTLVVAGSDLTKSVVINLRAWAFRRLWDRGEL